MITFKAFHSSDRLSQETIAYDTKVMFEGKLLGQCRNDGGGGMGFFQADAKADPALMAQAQAWVKTQTYKEDDGSDILDSQGKPLDFGGIEDYCDYLAGQVHEHKMMLAQVKRLLKTKTLFTGTGSEQGIYQLARAYSPAIQEQLEAKYPGTTVLNILSIDEAFKLFKADAQRQIRDATAQAAVGRKPKGP